MWSMARRHRGRQIRTYLAGAFLALAALLAVDVGAVVAAGGTTPTAFNTGSVTCRNDLIQSESVLVANRPVMQTAGTYFNGYFAAFSKVQFSTDKGATWHDWAGTKRSHGRTRVYGSGASAFHGVSWGPFSLPAAPTAYAIRVKTTFRWLNPNKVLVAQRVRIVDYYRTEMYWPDDPYGSLTTSSRACVLLLG